MKHKAIIGYAENSDEFYPTPVELVNKMLHGIDWTLIKTILEPSAGKGDILKAIARKEKTYGWGSHDFDVDAIEIDPNLRQILKYSFSEQRKQEERKKDRYSDYKENDFFCKGIHIVHDDFLTYEPFKTYDIIIMNPPFSKGCEHLLKALEIQKRGGSIVCLLNAETIRNPFTDKRRELIRLLNQYEAQIEYIENGFINAEHRTDVEVALVKISIPHEREESDFYERMKKAENMTDDFGAAPGTELDVTDYIKSAVQHFKVEIKAGLELIRQYRALQPYMQRSLTDEKCTESILRLTTSYERSYDSVSINEYVRLTRLKYWRALLSNPKFTGKLTSKLQSEYNKKVEDLGDYDFDEYNIQVLSAEMMAQVQTGIEDEIMAMFERLTVEHSWHQEFSTNRHYYDGWATNKAYKVNKKVILPCYGIFSEWGGSPRTYEAAKVLADIERIMNFFSTSPSENVNIEADCKPYFEQGITKNVPFKHFTATFYKKGTVHVTFTDERLLDRFNIYAGMGKNFLPPSYGKKKYKDMTDSEKRVIDSFQGEKKYEEVLREAQYYLASPLNTENVPMLSAAY